MGANRAGPSRLPALHPWLQQCGVRKVVCAQREHTGRREVENKLALRREIGMRAQTDQRTHSHWCVVIFCTAAASIRRKRAACGRRGAADQEPRCVICSRGKKIALTPHSFESLEGTGQI
ncbi:hypothetical protein MRX96_000624 [Rhipicephalus microplus]